MQATIFTDSNAQCIFFSKNNIEKYIKKDDLVVISYELFRECKNYIISVCKKIYVIFDDTEIIPYYLANKKIIPCKASSMLINKHSFKVIGNKQFIRKMLLYSNEIIVRRDKKMYSNKKISKTTALDKNNQFELISFTENNQYEEKLYIRH